MCIQWKKNLELGNDLIDIQHRMLILLYRKLDIVIKSHASEKTIRLVILEIKKFAEFHFVSEETLMHEIGYPDVDNHAIAHTGLLRQLESMLIKINQHQESPDELLGFLSKWIENHIMHDDLKIAEYLKECPRRPIGEHLYYEYFNHIYE